MVQVVGRSVTVQESSGIKRVHHTENLTLIGEPLNQMTIGIVPHLGKLSNFGHPIHPNQRYTHDELVAIVEDVTQWLKRLEALINEQR